MFSFFPILHPIGQRSPKKSTVGVFHLSFFVKSIGSSQLWPRFSRFADLKRNEKPLWLFFLGIASQWDGELDKKITSYKNPILKMVMGSQFGLLGRKRSFQ
jgi:hypothetical protein